MFNLRSRLCLAALALSAPGAWAADDVTGVPLS